MQAAITVTEMEDSLRDLIRCVQRQEFSSEWKALRENRPIPASSKLRKLDPMLHKGVICVGGRLDNADGDDASKHPIVLPSHHLSRLIIRDVHERNAHVGCNHTLAHLRKKYFILKGYSLVSSVLSGCVACKKHHSKPMQQKMGNLPKERIEADKPPFTYVGVDYFGPMNVKFRRGTVKRYGCLFTCLVTRAVHLEVACALDSDSFLMALHRFIARRGKPQKIFSDNGTNFVGAERELTQEIQAINSNKLRNEMLVAAIEWSFNPPHAPHMGGAWERLVRSVKELLRHLVGDRLLTDEELQSFFCEAEKILNDRPLTRMGSDARDPTPLTPSDMLLLRGNSSMSLTEANSIRRRWQVVQQLANRFYERFVSEYIPELQVRQKWCAEKENLKPGDVVLVADEETPRGKWPLGIVKNVELGADGLVRAANVKTTDKERRRPIHKLVLLERHC